MSLSRSDLVDFLGKATDGDIDFSYLEDSDGAHPLIESALGHVERCLGMTGVESRQDISFVNEPICDYGSHATAPGGEVIALVDSQPRLSPFYAGRPVQAGQFLFVFRYFDPKTQECVFFVPQASRHLRLSFDDFMAVFGRVKLPEAKDHFSETPVNVWMDAAESFGFDAFTSGLRESLFQDRLKPGTNVMDIGSGPGYTWKGASVEGVQMTLIDGNAGFLEAAKSLLPDVRTIQHSFEGQPPHDFVDQHSLSSTQDAAVCIAMPYVPLAELFPFEGEVLKKDGWFFLTALDPEQSGGAKLWPRMSVEGGTRVCRPALRLAGTLRFAYSPEELVEEARDFGFELDGDLKSVQANVDPSFGFPEVYNCGFFRKS